MIHIIDTEHPWDVYCISSGHTEVISCLEWDQSGEPAVLLLFAFFTSLLCVRHCVSVQFLFGVYTHAFSFCVQDHGCCQQMVMVRLNVGPCQITW